MSVKYNGKEYAYIDLRAFDITFGKMTLRIMGSNITMTLSEKADKLILKNPVSIREYSLHSWGIDSFGPELINCKTN